MAISGAEIKNVAEDLQQKIAEINQDDYVFNEDNIKTLARFKNLLDSYPHNEKIDASNLITAIQAKGEQYLEQIAKKQQSLLKEISNKGYLFINKVAIFDHVFNLARDVQLEETELAVFSEDDIARLEDTFQLMDTQIRDISSCFWAITLNPNQGPYHIANLLRLEQRIKKYEAAYSQCKEQIQAISPLRWEKLASQVQHFGAYNAEVARSLAKTQAALQVESERRAEAEAEVVSLQNRYDALSEQFVELQLQIQQTNADAQQTPSIPLTSSQSVNFLTSGAVAPRRPSNLVFSLSPPPTDSPNLSPRTAGEHATKGGAVRRR